MKAARRIVLLMLALALSVVGVSWIRSYSALDQASYRYGTLRAPGEDRDDPAMWTYTDQKLSVSHYLGRIDCALQSYKSLGTTREQMQDWLDKAHWERMTVAANTMRGNGPHAWFYVESAADWNLLGLGMSHVAVLGNDIRVFTVPHWLAALVVAGLLTRVALGSRVARRRRRGLCPKCAYDLKGAFQEGCPECGWGRAKPAVGT